MGKKLPKWIAVLVASGIFGFCVWVTEKLMVWSRSQVLVTVRVRPSYAGQEAVFWPEALGDTVFAVVGNWVLLVVVLGIALAVAILCFMKWRRSQKKERKSS